MPANVVDEIEQTMNKPWRVVMCLAFSVGAGLAPRDAYALHNTPGVIEAGDRISFTIPVQADSRDESDLENVHLVVSSLPPWLTTLNTSILGPVTLPSGVSITFRLDVSVNSTFNPSQPQGEIVAEVQADSTALNADQFIWHFRTSNGFLTYRSQCLDSANHSYADGITPDRAAPLTDLTFMGNSFTDSSGNIFLASQTAIAIEAFDPPIQDAATSGVAFTGFLLDQSASSIEQLQSFISTFTLSLGNHVIVFASSDNARNVELIKSQSLFVDGLAPEAPVGLLADGASPSPWKNLSAYALTWQNPSDASGVGQALVKIDGNAEYSTTTIAALAVDLGAEAAQGLTPVQVRLADNVRNNDPSRFSTVQLRFDSINPNSSAVSPSTTSASPIIVSFDSSDSGAGGPAPTGSGIFSNTLWFRRDHNGDGFYGAWQQVPGSVATGATAQSGGPAQSSGTFTFNPLSFDANTPDGDYQLYVQARDAAGNAEAAPTFSTVFKAQTYFDRSVPVMANIRTPAISPSLAQVQWETDDLTTALVEYGTSTAFGSKVVISTFSRTHNAFLFCHVISPALFYYRVTVTNRTGLKSVSEIRNFVTPPNVVVPADLFGVVDLSQPITVTVTNPEVTSTTFTVDGQSGGGTISTATAFEIFVSTPITGPGTQVLTLKLDGITFATQFVVDTATRTVRLARLAVSGGGLMTDGGTSMLDLTMGQTSFGPPSDAGLEYLASANSRLHTGYYSGIDPKAPAPINTLTAVTGSGPGEIRLSWMAVGDDSTVGTAMKYELRRATYAISDSNFASVVPVALSVLPAISGTAQQAIVSGLSDGTTYFFALKAVDELLNGSLIALSASAKTLEIAKSTDTINGKTAVELFSSVSGISISVAPTTGANPAVALATSAAAAQGLIFVSNIYDILSPTNPLPSGASIRFRYDPTGFDPTLEDQLRVYHFDTSLNSWTLLADVPPDLSQDLLIAPITNLSLFALMLPDHDPPVTTLAVKSGGQFVAPAGTLFIATATVLSLSARDPPLGRFAGTGILRTEFRIDGSPFTPLDLANPSFQVPAGLHTVGFRSIDRAKNIEPLRSAALAVDGGAPIVSYSTAGAFLPLPEPLIVLGSSAVINIQLIDPLLAEGRTADGSGVSGLSYSVNGSTFLQAISNFTIHLAAGSHALSLTADDRVGNRLDRTANPFRIIVGDVLPPRTALAISTPQAIGADGTVFLTRRTPLNLTSADDLSAVGDEQGLGVAVQKLLVDGILRSTFTNPSPAQGQVFSSSFTLADADGLHLLEFSAQDIVQNSEAVHRSTVAVDNAAPATELVVGSPSFGAYISSLTPLAFSAADVIVNGVASGLALTRFQDNGAAFQTYAASFTVSEGAHAIGYQSQDNVQNLEVLRSSDVLSDATPPITALSVTGGRQFPGPDRSTFYASSDTLFILVSIDPISNGVASGLAFTRYQDNDGAFTAYAVPFSLPEGAHKLAYQSQDNVQNLEILKSTNAWIDSTPPTSAFLIGAPSFIGTDGAQYISTSTLLSFSAVDAPLAEGKAGSGVGRIELAIDNGPFVAYASPLTFAEGRHSVVYRSIDNVGNMEVQRALALQVDATPPTSNLVIGTPQFQLPGVLLVSSQTPISINAVDPVSNAVASGFKDSFYRVSDVTPSTATFSLYTAAFTLSGMDTNKVVEFFSRDNVLNLEAAKSATLLLDSTPPHVALLSPSDCNRGICRILKGQVPVIGAVFDAHLEGYRLEFAPGKDAVTGYSPIASSAVNVSSATLGVWDTSALSGWQTLKLSATDLVKNAAATQVNVFIGDPATLMVLGNHDVFNLPEGVAVSPEGTLYVADRNNDRIAVFSATGTLLGSFGEGDKEEDDEGDDQDKKGGKDDEGKEKKQKPAGALRFNKPKAVALDEQGNLLVADTNNDRVLKLSTTGQLLLELGRPSSSTARGEDHQLSGAFNKPSGVAAQAGLIYVADTENRRIQVFASDGSFVRLFFLPQISKLPDDDADQDDEDVNPLGKPFGLALDGANNLYVADPKGRRVLKYDSAGNLLATIGTSGTGLGQFRKPEGVAVTKDGQCLLVSDKQLGRIQKFDGQGRPTLVFGAKGKIKDDKPLGSGIRLLKPIGVALDAENALYVADRNNDRVQKFSLPNGQATLIVPPPQPSGNVARDVVDREEGGEVKRSDLAGIQVPEKALSEDLKITVSPPVALAADERDRQASLRAAGLAALSAPVEFQPEGTKFAAPVTLTLPYSPELAGIKGVSDDDLKINYWNREKGRWEVLESKVNKNDRTVTAKTTHFSLYQVLSGTASLKAETQAIVDPSFAFRDLYAFPNPALRGKKPIIRLQVGLADSVDINIYDISGQLVSQGSVNDAQVIDDGNGKGPQYTYDYTWDTSGVGSGVYIYAVTAKKNGRGDIRRSKKLGVVR